MWNRSLFVLIVTACLLSLLATSCSRRDKLSDENQKSETAAAENGSDKSQAKTSGNSRSNSQKILRDLFSTYKSCATYQDNATISIVNTETKETINETDLRLSFERPNLISLQVATNESQLKITCNGQHFRSSFVEPNTKNFFNQVTHQAAPEELTVTNLYSISEYSDASRKDFTTSLLFELLPIHLEFSQLALLISKRTFEEVFQKGTKFELLDDRSGDLENCYRIRVTGTNKKKSIRVLG